MTIFQPNLTFRDGGHQGVGYQVQSESWMYHADACGRPPGEVQQSIICATCFITESTYLTGSAGGDWDLFSTCCPFSGGPTTLNKTIYYSASNCTSNYCITSDEELANDWDKCVKDVANKKINIFANQSVEDVYCGRCEFLDHEFLKSGLQTSGASTKGIKTFVLIGLVFYAILL
ncbi:hypothetical protein FPOAC2_12888 [Fusarium poae]